MLGKNSVKVKKKGKNTLMSDECCHITRWLQMVSHLWKVLMRFYFGRIYWNDVYGPSCGIHKRVILGKCCNLCLKIFFFFSSFEKVTATFSRMAFTQQKKKMAVSPIFDCFIGLRSHRVQLFSRVISICYNQIHTRTFSGLTTTFSVKGTTGQVCQAKLCVAHMHASCLFVSPGI